MTVPPDRRQRSPAQTGRPAKTHRPASRWGAASARHGRQASATAAVQADAAGGDRGGETNDRVGHAAGLWTDDVPAAYAALTEGSTPGLMGPHEWLGRLLIAWVTDPDGHPVQLVQTL